ncbi:class I SAM-dependent methyltransferase [Paenibacillus sp. ISL-20]|uniref:class I SAM-dependent methyltransferase n=1 Tax=Paenibacillus sp. ISL-20 TaxID=2819163 RepID=UPI001BEC98CE|nr:class I SAM-dependent methyltransferase [Paenibacillus sp. ISL-20]MBT2760494.1 class I SAM-dependent methyltransferase [Paenibacillus sp. ISL-20]
MSEYYWDSKIEYLRNTRWLYYNDDYLEFLVKNVWKLNAPVNIVDYGCGYGYLGVKLLPLLPEGSTYTGIDKGEDLIKEAREVFDKLPYSAEFIQGDIEDMFVHRQYDVAICHAFLLHMANPRMILQKMIDSVLDGGRVICFEPHWIANTANYGFDEIQHSEVVPLGILQKLYEESAKDSGKDGNIGMKLPIFLSQLGLRNVECRVSDKVNFLDQNMEAAEKDRLFQSLKEEGIGQELEDSVKVVEQLVQRGLSVEEAQAQYAAELKLFQVFDSDSWLAYAPNMKISFGTVSRE